MSHQLKADRDIDGVPVVGRISIAAAAGKSLTTINHDALAPDKTGFPPLHATINRTQYYRLTDAQTYLDAVTARDNAKKVTVPTGGDPTQMLEGPAAAEEIGVDYRKTFGGYVRKSIPFWEQHDGRDPHGGLLPPPDETEPRGTKLVTRRWRRDTLQNHQAKRPGRGHGAGRHPKHPNP